MNLSMKPINVIKILATAAIMTAAVGPAHAAQGGNKDKGNPDGGFIDAVYSAVSSDPYIPYVESNSADTKGQIVFYGHMDMSIFTGTWDSGGECSMDDLYDDDKEDGLIEGIIVIFPQDSKNPGSAELRFWYRNVLESGKEIQHLLTMQGEFDDRDNWPPSETDRVNTVLLDYWEFGAENRKAQRQDCSGSSGFAPGVGPWEVIVTRE